MNKAEQRVTSRVTLLSSTQNKLELIYASLRQCYYPGSVADMWPKLESGTITPAEQTELVTRILASGHQSPVEHVSFSFAVDGVSRALTHQLVRHRLASYSQQSQRYVSAKNFSYVVPPAILANEKALQVFESCMDDISAVYSELVEQLTRAGHGKAAEDARFVLPQAAETRIVVTMNCRTLLHFFEERCCTRAQWEIRGMANQMLAICQKELPVIFENAGAKCEKDGFCPESAQFTCGRWPRRDGR